jgi:prenyltransferase/squalene oxidase-like repeat protein
MRRIPWFSTIAAATAALVAGAALHVPAPIAAAQRDPAAAIQRGLSWLEHEQRPDGAWPCNVGFLMRDSYEVTGPIAEQLENGGGHVGVTALAGMAFLAERVPGRKDFYAGALDGALRYVLACVKEDGYVTDHQSNMYSHALAVRFLAQVYATTNRRDVLEALWLAIDLIEKSQDPTGGWGYLPFEQGVDTSVTACVLLALGEADARGVDVSDATRSRAVRFLRRCAVPEGENRGGFKYRDRPMNQTRASFPLTAGAIAALCRSGVASADPIVVSGLAYLRDGYDHLREIRRESFEGSWGSLLASDAASACGGDALELCRARLERDLPLRQREDGSWHDDVGDTFATACAVLALQNVR